ncbi:MAG: PEP-CTERM sorting domain-containing protein [Chthoniobacteraceae bacterium]|jgi:hypothetical protein
MKLKLIQGAVLCAAAVMLASSARAQVSPPSQPPVGDLLLCFRVTGGTGVGTDVLFDLGAYNSFETSLDVGSTLAAVYGSNWASDSSLFWSVLGAGKVTGSPLTDVLFASSPTGDIADPVGTTSNQKHAATDINNLYTAFASGTTGDVTGASEMTSGAYTTQEADLSANSWLGQEPFETSGDIGSGSDSVFVTELNPASGGSATDLGTFTLGSNGEFTAAVPEPSTWGCMILGMACLFIFGRRRARA